MSWQYVKSLKKDNVSHSSLRDSDGSLVTDPQKMADIFNLQFKSVFSDPLGNADNSGVTNNYERMPSITVSQRGVLKLLQNINPHKATGPDNIPGKILKELAVYLAPVYTILFQASLDQGSVPEDWKTAHITPIFKKGDPKKAANYRPISLTSITCKLLEHIIHSNIMKHFDSNQPISPT